MAQTDIKNSGTTRTAADDLLTDADPAKTGNPFSTSTVSKPHLFTDDIIHERELRQKRAGSKAALSGQAYALKSSLEIGLSQLQNEMAAHPSAALTRLMAEYQALEQNVDSVLSALQSPHVSIAALKRLEAVIAADLAFDEDGAPGKAAEDDAKEKREIMLIKADIAHMDAEQQKKIRHAADAHPFMRLLFGRSEEITGLLDDNASLGAQAADRIEMGKADLMAAVALAALLYDAYRHPDQAVDVEKFIAAQMEKMRGAAGGVISEEALAARVKAISEKAQFIHEGMVQGQAEGAKRLLEAAKFFVIAPVQQHMEDVTAHLSAAGAHLDARVKNHAGGKDAQECLANFNSQAESLTALQSETRATYAALLNNANASIATLSLNTGSGEQLYADLAQALKLGDITDNLSGYVQGNASLLEQQAGIFRQVKQRTDDAMTVLPSVLMGQSADKEALAQELGTKSSVLNLAALRFQIEQAAPLDRGCMKRYIEDSYSLLKTAVEDRGSTHA